MKKIIALLFITLAFSGCEKDDVCIDETTPRLVIEFYDISNPSVLKNVLNLKVRGIVESGFAPDFIVFNSATNDSKYLFNGNKLELPLRINGNTTKYKLILNSTGTTVPPNEDIIQFNYIQQKIFVSRACGYKTIFTLDNAPNGVIVTDAAIPDSFWIQQGNINIQTNAITTENETHIKIYF